MRACLAGAECELKESEKVALALANADPKAKANSIMLTNRPKKCGMDIAYAYFVSFVFLSSFLVRNFTLKYKYFNMKQFISK